MFFLSQLFEIVMVFDSVISVDQAQHKNDGDEHSLYRCRLDSDKLQQGDGDKHDPHMDIHPGPVKMFGYSLLATR